MSGDAERFGPILEAKVREMAGRLSPLDPDDYDPEPARPDTVADIIRARDDLLGSHYLGQWRGRIPSRFAWADLDQFDGPEHDSIRDGLTEWAKEPAGRNLVLFGPVGTGKSHAAVAACRPAAMAGATCHFLPVDELLDMLRPDGPPGAFDALVSLPRLIIDDIGAERQTEWTAERLFSLVNRRWLEELPTVATSNLDPTGLAQHAGERLFSRLVGNDAVVLLMSGDDRRRAR